jgi:hypothetical protein
MLQLGFVPSKIDTSLFIFSWDKVHIYMLVYVDDIIIVGPTYAVDRLVHSLYDTSPIKFLGRLGYFLGIEVSYNSWEHIFDTAQVCALDVLYLRT